MSNIPFVTALGDALDAAIAAPAPRRRPRRRLLAIAIAAVMLAGGGLALARLLTSPEKLAAGPVACYDSASLGANMAAPGGVGAPLDLCARVYREAGEPVPPLVACADRAAIAVFPGRGDDVCRRLGLAPVPRGYAAARARVAELQSQVLAAEGADDCLRPAALAARVQALLDRDGWTGWRAALRLDSTAGPCGTVSHLGGGSERSIDGQLDADRRLVYVSSAPYRSTERLLMTLAPRLEDASGASCFDEAAARTAARGLSDRPVTVRLTVGRPAGEEFGDAREARYRAGCTVITDVRAAADGRSLVVELLRRG
jgi:hypothetical protein